MLTPEAIEHTTGLAQLLDVASDAADIRALGGLVILSAVAAEKMPGIHMLQPFKAMAFPRRVGLRPIENAERKLCTILGPGHPAAKSCVAAYEYYCTQFEFEIDGGMKPLKCNSGMKRLFEGPEMANPQSITCLSARGNYLGDRGILPVLEVARLCPNLTTLDFSDNGLKNSAVEWIAHFLLDAALPTLTCVNISKNRITIGAAIVMLEAAKRNKNLTTINVEETRIDQALKDRINAQLLQNQQEKRRGAQRSNEQ